MHRVRKFILFVQKDPMLPGPGLQADWVVIPFDSFYISYLCNKLQRIQ